MKTKLDDEVGKQLLTLLLGTDEGWIYNEAFISHGASEVTIDFDFQLCQANTVCDVYSSPER